MGGFASSIIVFNVDVKYNTRKINLHHISIASSDDIRDVGMHARDEVEGSRLGYQRRKIANHVQQSYCYSKLIFLLSIGRMCVVPGRIRKGLEAVDHRQPLLQFNINSCILEVLSLTSLSSKFFCAHDG